MTKLAKFPFLKGFLILFVIVSGILFLLKYIKPEFIYPEVYIIQVFFLFVTSVGHLISSQGLKQKKDFHIFYMLSMAVRLFSCIIFVTAVLFSSSHNLALFVGNFFTIYLVYTSFEVYFLLRNLRADFKRDA